MPRKTLWSKIQEAAKNKKNITIKKLSTVNYVATTQTAGQPENSTYKSLVPG